jgi:septal ring factor EnvC (AmiA/AmiB activator)
MTSARLIAALAAAVLGCAAPAWCASPAADPAALEQRITTLEEQNATLRDSLVESRRREHECAETLASIRTRLEALGHNLFNAGDDRLVQAAADLEVLTERVRALEAAATNLAGAIGDYLRQAVVADPAARMQVETSLRELDAAIGLREKPRPDVQTGSLQGARVVSIDSRSGLLVLNVGRHAGARVGMTFQLARGERPFGRAIVADVRDDVSGAFIEALDAAGEQARIGDAAIIEAAR